MSIILELFIKYKKYLLPLAVIVGLTISAFLLVNGLRKSAYNEGVHTERAAWVAKKAEAEAKNRAFESTLRDIVETFGKDAVEKAAKRVSKETVYLNKVESIIKEKPIYTECKADQEVIDSRNAIRAGVPSDGAVVRVEF